MKFKVGDKVIGLPSANTKYNHTCEGYIGEVTKLLPKGHNIDDDDIMLNDQWSVQSKYFKLYKTAKVARVTKPTKFVVFYDENNHDPMKEFSTDKELKTWLKEAMEDEDIDTDSIKIFEVKKELFFNVKKSITFTSKRKEIL